MSAMVLDELAEHHRRITGEQAAAYRALAELRELDALQFGGVRFLSAELAHRSLRAEIAAALRIGERAVETRLSLADDLVERLPATLEALADGRISDRLRERWSPRRAVSSPNSGKRSSRTRSRSQSD